MDLRQYLHKGAWNNRSHVYGFVVLDAPSDTIGNPDTHRPHHDPRGGEKLQDIASSSFEKVRSKDSVRFIAQYAVGTGSW